MTAVPDRVAQSFRRGLATYHDAAVAQARIASQLIGALMAAGAPLGFRQGLEFGCGTGHLTTQILQRLSVDRLLLNDLVEDCRAAVQPLLQDRASRVSFQAGDIAALELPMGLDLVASASTVQWLDDPCALLAILSAHMAPGGWLAISGYGRGHFAELSAAGARGRAASYLDPDDWRAILPGNLHLHHLAEQSLKLEFADAVGLLKHLRQTGVNAGVGTSWSRARLAEFNARLRADQPEQAPLTLTYCPVFLIAQKLE